VSALVLDAGIALASVLPERHSEAARTVLLGVAETGAIVPALWHLEIANALLAAERRGLLAAVQRQEVLENLSVLPIASDSETAAHAWSDSLALARDYALSVPDAAYLELARRRDVPLASFDAALLRAAAAVGVRTF